MGCFSWYFVWIRGSSSGIPKASDSFIFCGEQSRNNLILNELNELYDLYELSPVLAKL